MRDWGPECSLASAPGTARDSEFHHLGSSRHTDSSLSSLIHPSQGAPGCSWSPAEELGKSEVDCFLLHSFLSQAILRTRFYMYQMFLSLFRFNPFYLSPGTCLLCSISLWELEHSGSAKTDLICTWENTIMPMPCHPGPV